MKVLGLVILLATSLIVPASLQARWIKDKILYRIEDAGNVEFSHYRHLEIIGNDCPSCHNDIFHIVTAKNPKFKMKDMEQGKSCGACHNGKQAFSVADDCDACHQM